MSTFPQNENECHVCQHLGEKQCRYTSHKKYRNQKGDQSFKVDIISHSPIKGYSYLKNFQMQTIQFEFPSLIPPFSGHLIGMKQNDEKRFERTLIEKVLEGEQSEVKTEKAERIYSNTNLKVNEVKQFSLEEKVRHQIKKSISFLRHHKAPLPKEQSQPFEQQKKEQVKFQMIEKAVSPKQIEQPKVQISSEKKDQSLHTQTNLIEPKPHRYHFDYSFKQPTQQLLKNQREMSNIKSNQSSFHIEDYRFNCQTTQMFISRVNQKERSNFYVGNVFKDGSEIHQIDKANNGIFKDTSKSKFEAYMGDKTKLSSSVAAQNVESLREDIIQSSFNTSYRAQMLQNMQRNQTHTLQPSKLLCTPQINVSIDQTKRSFSTHHEFPQSRIRQEVPVYIHPNQSIQTKRSNFDNSQSSHFSHYPPKQKFFYPIYPVYEVVYELVKVIPDQFQVGM